MQSYNDFAKAITEACWKGYERTPDTKEGEDGSCRKKKAKKKKVDEAKWDGPTKIIYVQGQEVDAMCQRP